MTEDTKQEAESDVCFVEDVLPKTEMLAMGLPTSFGANNPQYLTETGARKDPVAKKRRYVIIVFGFAFTMFFQSWGRRFR